MIDETVRTFVRSRARDRCEYCRISQFDVPFPRFHIEHVIPIKHGGSDAAENLALACNHCNLHKGPNLSGIDPQTVQLSRLFNPRTDAWADHFRQDGPNIVGLTSIGRTTVNVLEMNAFDRVELRRDLLSRPD